MKISIFREKENSQINNPFLLQEVKEEEPDIVKTRRQKILKNWNK